MSLPIRTRGAWLRPRPATNVTARPSASASSGVIGWTLAVPRMPSVPKSEREAVRWVTRGLLRLSGGLEFYRSPAGRRSGRTASSAGRVSTTESEEASPASSTDSFSRRLPPAGGTST